MSSKIRQILKKYLQKMAKKGHEKATKKTKILIPIHSMREEETNCYTFLSMCPTNNFFVVLDII